MHMIEPSDLTQMLIEQGSKGHEKQFCYWSVYGNYSIQILKKMIQFFPVFKSWCKRLFVDKGSFAFCNFSAHFEQKLAHLPEKVRKTREKTMEERPSTHLLFCSQFCHVLPDIVILLTPIFMQLINGG